MSICSILGFKSSEINIRQSENAPVNNNEEYIFNDLNGVSDVSECASDSAVFMTAEEDKQDKLPPEAEAKSRSAAKKSKKYRKTPQKIDNYSLKNKPALKKIAEGRYIDNGKNTAADAAGGDKLSKNAAVLMKSEQIKILQDAGIDIKNDIAGNAPIVKIKAKDGSVHYYKAVSDKGVIKVIHTKIKNKKAEVEIYGINDTADKKTEQDKAPEKDKKNQTEPVKKQYAYPKGMNGRIDQAVYQGKTGDCWLLSGILALNASPEGRAIIKNSIIPNKDGSVTVNLMGAGVQYTFSQKEIKQNDPDRNPSKKYSRGDNDMLVLEMAAEKFRKEHMGRDLSGGYQSEILEMLVPKGEINHIYGRELTQVKINNLLEDAAKNKNAVLSFDLKTAVKRRNAKTGRYYYTDGGSAHALAVTKITKTHVVCSDPHNSNKTQTLTRSQFSRLSPLSLYFINLDKT